MSNSRSSTGPKGGGGTVGLASFQNETFDFVATGANSTLTFDEPTEALAHSEGVGLDDVIVPDLGMTPVAGFASFAVGALCLLAVSRMSLRDRPGGRR